MKARVTFGRQQHGGIMSMSCQCHALYPGPLWLEIAHSIDPVLSSQGGKINHGGTLR